MKQKRFVVDTAFSFYSRETEQRAQTAEESEARKSAELVDALQKLRSLERQMEEIQNGAPVPPPTNKPASEPARYAHYFS